MPGFCKNQARARLGTVENLVVSALNPVSIFQHRTRTINYCFYLFFELCF